MIVLQKHGTQKNQFVKTLPKPEQSWDKAEITDYESEALLLTIAQARAAFYAWNLRGKFSMQAVIR